MANRHASVMVRYAVKHGFLPHVETLKCVDCDKPAVAYDHRDYSKPLDVDPVCTSCNGLRGAATGKHDNGKIVAHRNSAVSIEGRDLDMVNDYRDVLSAISHAELIERLRSAKGGSLALISLFTNLQISEINKIRNGECSPIDSINNILLWLYIKLIIQPPL